MSVVILTRGDRPEALDTALASVVQQVGIRVEVVVVWNGVPNRPSVDGGDAGVAGLSTLDVWLPENLGIPEGRNVGARHSSGAYLFFLDDDAEIVGTDPLVRIIERFDLHPDLGVIGTRVIDEHGETAQRHVPRWGRRSAEQSGEVTAFLGGVVAIRRDAFEAAGGYAGEFFYSMEETDLAWRLADAGWRIWYDAELLVRHPRTAPSRHPDAAVRTARNRVWLVHRTLPVPLGVVYLFNWLLLAGIRSPSAVAPTLRGYRDGWRTRIGPRRPIRWRTVSRLSRLGRPPVL